MTHRRINSNNVNDDVIVMSQTDNYIPKETCLSSRQNIAIGIDSEDSFSSSGTFTSELSIYKKGLHSSWSEWWDQLGQNISERNFKEHEKYIIEACESKKSTRELFSLCVKDYIDKIDGILGTYVKFRDLEDGEYFNQEFDLYFLVTSKLFLNIEILYDKLRDVRKYFETEKKIMINYNYTIFSENIIKEYVPKKAQKL